MKNSCSRLQRKYLKVWHCKTHACLYTMSRLSCIKQSHLVGLSLRDLIALNRGQLPFQSRICGQTFTMNKQSHAASKTTLSTCLMLTKCKKASKEISNSSSINSQMFGSTRTNRKRLRCSNVLKNRNPNKANFRIVSLKLSIKHAKVLIQKNLAN